MRVETIGNATLYLGDCREVLPTLSPVDACITDPPYGVNLGHRANNNRERDAYASIEDSAEIISDCVLPALAVCRGISRRVVLTPGNRNLFRYPAPDHVGAIYYPAGAGCNSWGFTCWQPILYYGKDPYGGTGSRPDSFSSTEAAEQNGHPCPKPIRQMVRIVDRCTLPNETILDPFMGSGTTGVACARLGRKFIGIECHEPYFDIAVRRITEAQRQGDLLRDIPPAADPADARVADLFAPPEAA